MADPLLSGFPRSIASAVGVPVPARLERERGPWKERPLEGRAVTVALAPGGALAGVLATALARAGAEPAVAGGPTEAFAAAAEAFSRPWRAVGAEPTEDERPRAVVLDATGVASSEELRAVYDLLHARVRALEKSGRVVVLARPSGDAGSLSEAAARRALDGFSRSLARELGRKGATANLLEVAQGAEDRVEPALRFLLSPRSAYVSGQVWRLNAAVQSGGPAPLIRPLDGRVAVVTGAARGIGAATARALAREGARVVLVDRPGDEGPLSEVAAEVGGALLAVDVTAADAAERIGAFAAERFGRLDAVVQNAGITRDKTLGRMPPELWDLVLDVNLGAVLRLAEGLTPAMGEGGRVVLLTSVTGIAGNVGQTNYSASKAGVIGVTEALAARVAGRGIAVNAVAPGFIETRLTAAIPVATREVARRLSNLSQGGLPEDVAEVITFLCSPGAAGLSGQVLRVCGGAFIGA